MCCLLAPRGTARHKAINNVGSHVGLLKTYLTAALCTSYASVAGAQSLEMPTNAVPAERMENSWDTHPFKLFYADGRSLSSEELRGKMVFIDAWASWCAPCMPSLPEYETLYEKSLGNPHVKVLSVHLTDRYGRFDSAAEFLRSKELYYPVLHDPEGELVYNLDKVTNSFAVPHYVLLDGSGKVIRRYGEINDKVIMDVENAFYHHTKAMRQAAR